MQNDAKKLFVLNNHKHFYPMNRASISISEQTLYEYYVNTKKVKEIEVFCSFDI